MSDPDIAEYLADIRASRAFGRRVGGLINVERSCIRCEFNHEGRCRRYPPTQHLASFHATPYSAPVVADDYWCGEFIPKEQP